MATMNAVEAIPITAVAVQPTAAQVREILNRPMTAVLVLTSISSTRTGTATIPFSTAAQTSAFTGFKWNTLAAAPSNVATAIAP